MRRKMWVVLCLLLVPVLFLLIFVSADTVGANGSRVLFPRVPVRASRPCEVALAVSRLSETPVAEVIALRASKATWFEVIEELGLDPQQVRQQSHRRHLPPQQVRKLVVVLARLSGKSEREVVQLKTPDNTWLDVLESLNLCREEVRKIMQP